MSRIMLSDWDCYLLQRAVLLRFQTLAKKAVTTYAQSIVIQKKNRDLKSVYQDTHGLKHSVDWDMDVRQELLRAVHQLQNNDEQHQWVAGNIYNPHAYNILLDKLYQ